MYGISLAAYIIAIIGVTIVFFIFEIKSSNYIKRAKRNNTDFAPVKKSRSMMILWYTLLLLVPLFLIILTGSAALPSFASIIALILTVLFAVLDIIQCLAVKNAMNA